MKLLLIGILLLQPVNTVFADSLPKNSIYHISSTWKDQNSNSRKLNSFAGEKVIIGMVYTSCPHACPMTISKINKIEKAIAKLGVKKYQMVLASFDPKRDTPAHMKGYMKKRKLSESRWTFLSAPNDSVSRELAVALGINYKPLDDGEFTHSNVISVLDEKGVVKAKIESLSASIEPIVKAFK